jgi:hypothetical protein
VTRFFAVNNSINSILLLPAMTLGPVLFQRHVPVCQGTSAVDVNLYSLTEVGKHEGWIIAWSEGFLYLCVESVQIMTTVADTVYAPDPTPWPCTIPCRRHHRQRLVRLTRIRTSTMTEN